MRVLQIHNYYRAYGGECRMVDTERTLLEDAGHDVVPFTRASRSIDAWPAAKKMGLLGAIPRNPRAAAQLRRLIRSHKPDVAHVHNLFPMLSPAIYEALAEAGLPTVQTHHNYRSLCPNGLFYIDGQICTRCRRGFHHAVVHRCVRRSRLISLCYAWAIHRAWKRGSFRHGIGIHIALNRFFGRQLIQAGIPERRIRICGNFVTVFATAVGHKDDYFLYLGRLSPEKGLTTLIEAVQRAGVNLKIAGTGPLEAQLKAQAARKHPNQVTFLGHVNGRRKLDLIRRSCFSVVPSEWFEAFGLSAAESLANGTPVIASRIGGLTEVVEDGVSGFLFAPGDAGDLAAKLRQVRQDPQMALQMGRQALRRAREKLSPETHAQRLVAIYQEVIARFHAV
jgi:glycosyltransferase involved in cell wall biosynthesis